MRVIPYRREDAVAYARRWALGRNPAYYDFSELGGDCTNFVSQCLYAGAGVMNTTPVFGWYYLSPDDRAAAWTGVRFLLRFLTENMGTGPFGHTVDREEIRVGDPVFLLRRDGTPYHAVLVTARTPTLLIAAHTNDALNRPLRTYSSGTPLYVHIDGVRVP